MNKSPIFIKNVFEMNDYEYIYRKLEKLRALDQFVTGPGREDFDIETHPLWAKHSREKFKEKLWTL